jgi:hypothetical protein
LFVLLLSVTIGAGLAPRKELFLTAIAAIALLVPTIALESGTNEPYRQTEALAMQTTKLLIEPRRFNLWLDEGTKNYVRDLHRFASEGGFRPGDRMIDLSGVSPGAVYLMGGRPPGVPWVSAGYPGSNNYLHAALDRAGCKAVTASWILTEPDSRVSFSFGLLRRYGIDVPLDYRVIGVVHARRSYEPRDFEQLLLKPTRDTAVAIEACEQSMRDVRWADGKTAKGAD